MSDVRVAWLVRVAGGNTSSWPCAAEEVIRRARDELVRTTFARE